MALTLIKLPVQSKDDEQACYLQDDGFPAKAGGVPVLQHCVVVQPEHLKLWQAGKHYAEIEPAKENSTRSYDWLSSDLRKTSQLADGEAFVDMDNFSGDYDPVYQDEGALKQDSVNFVPKKRDPKEIVVYILDGGTLRTFVIQVANRGFGMGDMGAARTDRESEIEYYWWGNPAFGYAVGLDSGRYVGPLPDEYVTVRKDDLGRAYYRCSDAGIAHAAGTLPVRSTDPEAVIYKRFKDASDGLYAPDATVKDSGEKRKKKNWPYQPGGVRLVKLLDARDGLSTDYKTAVAKKRKGRAFEKRGKEIVREGGEGTAAGIVIDKSGVKRGAMPKKPNERAAGLVKSVAVQRFLASRGIGLDGQEMRSDQEWCHLVATSLKGSEEYYNFVLGSKHCNSEQLAIESALLFSLEAAKDAKRTLKVKITAYVVPDTEYLLGEIIRYKVLITGKDEGADRLLLDHLIDAQSESLSYPEYRVLHETVRRVIAVELGDKHVKAYEDRLNGRIKERLKAEGKDTGPAYTVDDDLKDDLHAPGEEDDEEMGESRVPWLRSKGEPSKPGELPEDEMEEDDE